METINGKTTLDEIASIFYELIKKEAISDVIRTTHLESNIIKANVFNSKCGDITDIKIILDINDKVFNISESYTSDDLNSQQKYYIQNGIIITSELFEKLDNIIKIEIVTAIEKPNSPANSVTGENQKQNDYNATENAS